MLPALQSGGVERGTLEIARALVAAGHESVVLSKGGRLVAELESGGSRHVTWDLGRKHLRVLLDVRRFRHWLADERPAILHARSRMPAWICWLAWRRMPADRRPRFVTTVHGLYSVSRYSAVMTRGERVIAVSDTARRYVADNYSATDPRRVVRIYRGIARERFHRDFKPSAEWLAAWRRDHPDCDGRALVTLPGRLTRLKGHIDFIAAMERLRIGHPEVTGVVVGGVDPRHRAYADEIERRGANLVFTGQRNDLREIMSISHAVVSVSQKPESFGRTVLEALSLGTPVIGYDHGGVGEVLARVFPDGRAPVGDAAAVAAKLATVLDDPDAARCGIRDHDFDLTRMCSQTLDLYAELADERRGAVADAGPLQEEK